MPWEALVLLPNIDVRGSIEANYAALANVDDQRLRALCQEHAGLNRMLSIFTDAFRRPQRPSVLLFNSDAPQTYVGSVSAFRDLIAIASMLHKRAMAILRNSPAHQPIFSNSFDFYPWVPRDNAQWVYAFTPALAGVDDVTEFYGQTSPEVSHHDLEDLDEPLLNVLVSRWERRHATDDPLWEDLALFRSLNMAFQAARTPFNTGGTSYDIGRLVGLWVSAMEILSHSGVDRTGRDNVLRILLRLPSTYNFERGTRPSCPPLRQWALELLYRIRNDYLHGNRVAPERLRVPNSNFDVSFYAALLYRLMLDEFLGLNEQPTDLSTPEGMAAPAQYRMQVRTRHRIEDALFTMSGHERTGVTRRQARVRTAPA